MRGTSVLWFGKTQQIRVCICGCGAQKVIDELLLDDVGLGGVRRNGGHPKQHAVCDNSAQTVAHAGQALLDIAAHHLFSNAHPVGNGFVALAQLGYKMHRGYVAFTSVNSGFFGADDLKALGGVTNFGAVDLQVAGLVRTIGY